MAATETILARAEPWLRANIRDGLRAVLPLPILALAWWFASMPLGAAATAGLVVYALFNLALLVALHRTRARVQPQRALPLLLASVCSDAILAGWLLSNAGPLTLGIFPIYTVLGIKALRYRRQFLWATLVPALLGPLYLSALYLDSRRPAGLTAEQSLAYWGLVGGSCLFVALLLLLSEHRLREARRLAATVEQVRNERNERVGELESVNNDLRVRIRRQQALEESLRAITGSLSLDEVLGQILDSMLQMLGPSRVGAASLTLVSNGRFDHRTISPDGTASEGWPELLARRVVESRAPVVVNDALLERDWRDLQRCGVLSAISVPLIDPDNAVRGALTVISAQRHAFTPSETRHLTSFSIQAAVAIHNAELHSELAHQQAMLEAVLRDIGDGLVVLDEQATLVLANPVARKAIQQSIAIGDSLLDKLDAIARDLRAGAAQGGAALLTRELRLGEEQDERHFQVYASLVHFDGQAGSHVAAVLHDITGQKLQERQRVEFISMVSHELRNPLNTLNGFLKVVLQGKAGELNELQREFLGLADGQAEALKGRITELLEFNRLESGRLRLLPQWANLTDLIIVTCARFQIQAEQSGLQLISDLPPNLPDLLIDSERISQVLTNLIENAMKATPAGGSIAVSAELLEDEVRVHVADTGVGIPADQQQKIFGRFYQLGDKSSKHGVHLGLGLSICQQIVEGHQGRIWVESTEGRGSRFTFALPLTPREQLVGAPATT